MLSYIYNQFIYFIKKQTAKANLLKNILNLQARTNYFYYYYYIRINYVCEIITKDNQWRESQYIQKLRHIQQMDPDQDQLNELFRQAEEKRIKQQKNYHQQSRKKEPAQIKVNNEKMNENIMDIETKKINKWKFQDLPEDVDFYLVEIYQFDKKLYMTGLMENGQSINVIANQSWKQIYFVLKDEDPEQVQFSESYLKRALEEIQLRIRKIGLRDNQYTIEMVKKQYVFEIQGIPRHMRHYCKVRFSFKALLNDQIQPTWQGQTFKYVIGTTYTPLQLLIVNRSIKGPCWVTMKKQTLKQNTRQLANGLCVQIQFSQQIEICETRKDPPTVRVLSFSLKSVIPSEVSTKKYFPTERKDQTHIYSISYHYCEDYHINIKEDKPKLIQRTYFLETLDRQKSQDKPYFRCKDEADMVGRFLSDVVRLDPDFITCHDASKTLDTLICRLPKLSGDRNSRSKFGRLNLIRDLSKTSQYQRISKFLAGRLLVDTYAHSKQMVKEIDYELQTMSTHLKSRKPFISISDQQAKAYLSTQKPLLMIKKCTEQSELTFDLMNHLQLLQMTRQLSNICGNLWKRSLENKRAERNQFLIMHQCFERDLIIPDKFRKNDDEEVEQKKKYQGGMVIEPKKGFKPDYILLLDFNSLYPSIIREYNVCFSVIERPKVPLDNYYKSKKGKKVENKHKKEAGFENAEDNPEEDQLEHMFANVKNCKSKDQWGFLPQIIDGIVAQRKKCKNILKKAKNPADKIILDIKQKCYKLVANSIYGCLGFSVSRFYSRPLAALITKKGRDSLIAAKDIAIKRGTVDVIYGDTDSIMLEPLNLKGQQETTEIEKLRLLKKVADDLKKQINNQYTFLQIDIDGIFKPLILLMKKKYVANKLTNFQEILMGLASQPKFSLEYKGIEIVRRDGCKIARDTQEDIIKILVRTDDSELDDRYNEIYEYFVKLKDELRSKPKDHFLFSKQLTKNPKDYVKGETMPHVKVALDRLKAGEKQQFLINHTMYYLICKSQNQDENFKNLAESAFDMKSYERSRKFTPQRALQIDYQYYKEVLLEPVLRLLVSIDKQRVVMDRLSDALQIKKTRRKAIYDKFQDNEEIATQKFGQVIGQNIKNKAKQLASEIKQIFPNQLQCINESCNEKCSLVDSQKLFRLTLQCPKCQKSLCPILYNLIRYKIKKMETDYYSNKKRCLKCNHNYQLNLMGACCPLQKKSTSKPKDQISFKLHNFLYLCKDLIEDTLAKNEHKNPKIMDIYEMIDDFLGGSQYEDVESALAQLVI